MYIYKPPVAADIDAVKMRCSKFDRINHASSVLNNTLRLMISL